MASDGKVRIGVIGAGRIGKIHIENLVYRVPDALVVAVADIDVENTQQWAAQYGIEKVVAEPKELINDATIDAVVICSPTSTHAEYVIEAARAGKQIFCEKPIAQKLDATKQALAAVDKAGAKLQIGFNRRFDRNFKHIRQLVESGEIGEPHIVNITSRDPAPPPLEYVKVSGGIFMDMTIHDFDMARYLTGSDVIEVYAVGNVLIDPQIKEAGDFDTAVTLLKFANGAVCTIDNSRQAVYGYDQRVEVFGSKGAAAAQNEAPTRVTVSNKDGVISDKPLYFFLERYMDSFAEEMNDFVTCVKANTVPPVTGEDGLQSLLIAMAAAKSAVENRPVKLSEIG
ncbi:MAG: inositol 2-dehydrogenase [Firmicutes bacterium]|nr:inositol 2-dehydrogenase [Bacillota bacterium]